MMVFLFLEMHNQQYTDFFFEVFLFYCSTYFNIIIYKIEKHCFVFSFARYLRPSSTPPLCSLYTPNFLEVNFFRLDNHSYNLKYCIVFRLLVSSCITFYFIFMCFIFEYSDNESEVRQAAVQSLLVIGKVTPVPSFMLHIFPIFANLIADPVSAVRSV